MSGTDIGHRDAERDGILAAIGAYAAWGVLPLFIRLIHGVDLIELVSQRVIWSLALIILLFTLGGTLPIFLSVLRTRRAMMALAASAVLIGSNWMTYVWSVQSGHVVAASLGYFLNPLVNVLLGVLVLKERLRRAQVIAIFVAAAGVALMATAALDTLWISILLAVTFGLYGLVRKLTPVPAMAGLGVETLLLAPFATGWTLWQISQHSMAFGQDAGTTALLVASGLVTTGPLVLFAMAAHRLPMSTLGLIQYLSPTLQFLTGILIFGEALNRGQIISFGAIWLGLVIFTADGFAATRRNRLAAAAATG